MERVWKAQDFNFIAAKKAFTVEAPENGNLHLCVVSGGNILVNGVTEVGEVVPVYAGHGIIHIRTNYEGFKGFEVLCEKVGSVRIALNSKYVHERLDKKPAPVPEAPKNLLQAMRQNVQKELGAMRETFGDNALPGYEVSEEDELFEEEIHERAIEARAEAERNAQQRNNDAENEAETDTDEGGNSEDTTPSE